MRGKEFLDCDEDMPAVMLRLLYFDRQLEIEITPSVARLPHLQPLHLGLSPELIKKFVCGEITSLSSLHFGERSVLVLPALTSGTLLSVTKHIPEGSRYSNWEEMKKNWYEEHGYSYELEDGAEPMVYYCVSTEDQELVCPEWTVRRGGLITVAHPSPEQVTQQFLQDLQACNSMVAGKPFLVSCNLLQQPTTIIRKQGKEDILETDLSDSTQVQTIVFLYFSFLIQDEALLLFSTPSRRTPRASSLASPLLQPPATPTKKRARSVTPSPSRARFAQVLQRPELLLLSLKTLHKTRH